MKCEDVESAMIDYLDMNLEKAYRDEIEKHLETCERCLDEMKDFQVILQHAETAEMEQPDETLRINFYHMLHAEINKLAAAKNEPAVHRLASRQMQGFIRIAAGIALLVAGALIGSLLNRGPGKGDENSQVAQLRTEMQSMKELMMFSMLKEESPSQRIKAVGFTDEIQMPDEKVLDVLTKTLNQDKNTNVRLAAAYSLSKYADRQSVRDSLVSSLSRQTEPIIQVVLMNILVEKKESSAVTAIKKIISDDKALKEVKDVAQKGLQTLL